MKTFAFWGSLAFLASVKAQYFSAGWSPGQKDTPTATSIAPEVTSTSSPAPVSTSGSVFDMTNLLSSPAVVSFLSRFGVNITERLDQAIANNKFWDDRIPLITDYNYGDLVVNETLTATQEKNRMWFMVISVTASQQEGVSKYLDEVFDAAYNISLVEGDLPDVRWGRIDYLNVTTLTTKWAIWQAPYLVFATNRGQTLRFLRGNRLRLSAEAMRDYLKEESWKTLDPWSTEYSPGGSREWMMDYFAQALTRFYNTFVLIPKWALFIISGGIGSLVIGLMHKKPADPKVEKQAKTPVEPSAAAAPTPPPPSPAAVPAQSSKRAGTRQRKTAKK